MPTTHTETKKILYAENRSADQDALSTALLENPEYTLCMTSNGKDAIEKLKQEHFDILLVDMDMPVMDGVETARIIRLELGKTADDLPILAVMDQNTQDKRNACFEVGIDDFLAKPVNKKELLYKLAQWIESRSVDSFTEVVKMFEDITPDDYPLLNTDQIKTFMDFIGEEKAKEIIQEFKTFYTQKIDIVFDNSANPEAVANELHAMASVSGNIGLQKFSMACRTLMNRLKEKDVDDRMTKLMEIQNLYDSSIEKLDKLIHAKGHES